MHPAEPLTEIRELFQVEEAANYLYANLIYRNSTDLDFNTAVTSFAEINKLQDDLRSKEQRQKEIQDTIAAAAEEGKSTDDLKAQLEDIESSIQDLAEEINTAESKITTNTNYVLNWKELVDVVSGASADHKDAITDLNKLIGSQRTTSSKEDRQAAYTSLLRGFIRPKDKYEQIFYSLPVTQRFISRPVCTLEQYIDFYKYAPDFINGTSTISGGRGRGVRANAVYLDSDSTIAKHYRLIREFVGGPGFEPGSEIAPQVMESAEHSGPPELRTELEYRTASDNGTIIKRIFASLNQGDEATVQDLPDLAQDSQEVLLLYADIMASRGKL